jgi:cysteine desulfurase / selenocysteine lyase
VRKEIHVFEITSKLSFAHLVAGIELEVPLLNGQHRRYINLDNAASTSSFKSVQRAINNFLEFYSSVHRGNGFKSQPSTHTYEHARKIVLEFLSAPSMTHICIFVKNTTEALNKLAHCFPFDEQRPLVVISGMEHHSNNLPWRSVTQVIHVGLTPDGQLD